MVFILWSVLLRLSNQNKSNSASQMLLESLRVQSGMQHLGGKVRNTPARAVADSREQQAINVFNPTQNSKGGNDTSSLYNKDAQYRYTFGAPAPGGYSSSFDKARNGGKPSDKGAAEKGNCNDSTAYPSQSSNSTSSAGKQAGGDNEKQEVQAALLEVLSAYQAQMGASAGPISLNIGDQTITISGPGENNTALGQTSGPIGLHISPTLSDGSGGNGSAQQGGA